MTDIDVTVIGGGAAGLMAAVSAARCGVRTRVIEHMDRIGKKILSTGNGKCNYTNAVQGLSCYRGENPAFVLPVFEQFGQEDTVRLFEELGIYPKIKNGYYYPASEQAVSVVEVFGMECDYLGVDLWTSCGLQSIQKTCTGYEIRTTKGVFNQNSDFCARIAGSTQDGKRRKCISIYRSTWSSFCRCGASSRATAWKTGIFQETCRNSCRNAGNTLPGKCAISTKRQPWDSPGRKA